MNKAANAGNKNMIKCGRKRWNNDDLLVAVNLFEKLAKKYVKLD